MKTYRVAATLALLAGFASASQATIVNINARNDPYNNPASLAYENLTAGTYNISVIDNTANGGYNGYTFATPISDQAKPYREAFSFVTAGSAIKTFDVSTGKTSGYYTTYATAADALTAFATTPSYALLSSDGSIAFASRMQLVLTADATVFFAVSDAAGAFWDNTGGVSLAITRAVPEPESYGLALAGLGALAVTSRRRKSV